MQQHEDMEISNEEEALMVDVDVAVVVVVDHLLRDRSIKYVRRLVIALEGFRSTLIMTPNLKRSWPTMSWTPTTHPMVWIETGTLVIVLRHGYRLKHPFRDSERGWLKSLWWWDGEEGECGIWEHKGTPRFRMVQAAGV
jgi:hypothetical protein